MAIEEGRLIPKVCAFQTFFSYIGITKQTSINTDSSISNWISTFNSVSQLIGFAVTKSDDKYFYKFLREVVFLLLFSFAIYCAVMAELWCMLFLNMNLDVRKLVVFSFDQVVNLSPISCLVYFRLCELPVRGIIMKIEKLEENLIICDIHFKIKRFGSVALFFWGFQWFTITSTILYMVWPTVDYIILDIFSIFYFEAWVTVPYLQFTTWICFLYYVLNRLQFKINEIYEVEFLSKLQLCGIRNRLDRTILVEPVLVRIEQIKRIIDVMKEVLNIAKELSSVYGVMVLLYLMNYLCRIILHAYDILGEDSHNFHISMRMLILHMIIRIIFMLPVFICCEHLSYNINEIIEVLRAIVLLHRTSCLNRIFQSLTLRLKHQSSTTQICGFLNLTYGSLLTIMTTATGFLVFQLQF